MDAGLYWRTARHLRASQALWQLRFRLFSNGAAPPAPAQIAVRPMPPIDGVIPENTGSAGEFCFLNAMQRWAGQPDWVCAQMPKLWRYNLHYFDYVLEAGRDWEEAAALIESWIRHNPPGTVDAWEPYTVSLRIVNWIKLFTTRGARRQIPHEWLRSLWRQSAWLQGNLERHILANHYLKNLKALVFAGAYFRAGPAARRFEHSVQLFEQQCEEQFLADGGHVERSPMYHCICTEDLLDVLNLAQSIPSLFDDGFRKRLRRRCAMALEWLEPMCLPDGEIALFNDSAMGIAAAPRALHDYAARVGVQRAARQSDTQMKSLAASGYFIVERGGDKLIVDCGAVGPDYQPGHAHCDTLSYELALDGRRVIVDAGVHDYEASEHRRYSRSTAAHNTVSVDAAEQSEVWGVFRVARRARPLNAKLRASAGGYAFEGAHDGYRYLPDRPVHRRRVVWDAPGDIEVWDEVVGGAARAHTAASRIRLHPEYKTVIKDEYAEVLEHGGRAIARIEFLAGVRGRVEAGWYFPRFGCALRCEVVVLEAQGRLPLRLGYRVRKVGT